MTQAAALQERQKTGNIESYLECVISQDIIGLSTVRCDREEVDSDVDRTAPADRKNDQIRRTL